MLGGVEAGGESHPATRLYTSVSSKTAICELIFIIKTQELSDTLQRFIYCQQSKNHCKH